ncbi:hypothetical protein [Streptomyces sp. KMM 9044]|uniref:hypothetical protein n=1 Tax=Streptomyces sp. KMM 9044 TaxID=2744474 RepID=UPI0022B232AE|nr:hypothetical protein [Streptomyces sp. KMM 9044]WAX82181.1 hypothetical protein HUV60_033055 [Streptomyces sp. KMM 9044]
MKAARTRPVTVAGRTREVPAEAPRLPTDWRSVAQTAALVVAGLITVATVVYSTMSIAQMLGGWWGYVGGAVFDAAWLVALLLAVVHRHDPDHRKAADRTGWLLLAVSMAVLIVHGIRVGDWGLAVGGPAVSLVAKVLWHTVLSSMSRPLSADAAAWLAAERDEAYAELAIADTAQQVLRSRGRAAQVRAALEAKYGELEAPQTRNEIHVERAAESEPEHSRAAELRQRAIVDQMRARASLEAAADAGIPAAEILSVSGRTQPETPAETPLTSAEMGGDLRPEAGRTPAEALSLRSTVHRLHALGVTQADTVERHAAAVLGKEVSRDSVERYLREARQAAETDAKGPGTGLYN